ncbi:hypothetical protein IMZ48_19350 [Candidatus Bathyarchaeota archaeon]|nr:hypothetical protein [Candidatus Bathyarchaeota archaeon]
MRTSPEKRRTCRKEGMAAVEKRRGFRSHAWRMREAFGVIWRPAPTCGG